MTNKVECANILTSKAEYAFFPPSKAEYANIPPSKAECVKNRVLAHSALLDPNNLFLGERREAQEEKREEKEEIQR